jgi:hypothetical protein
MPFALVGIGLILIVTGVRDTYGQLGAQLTKDFTGSQNFTVWILAIGSVGALGYVRELRTFSHYFLALILLSLILANQGFFQKFTTQWKAGPTIPTAPTDSAIPAGSAASSTPFGVFVPPTPDTMTPAAGDTGRNYIDKYRPCRLFPSLIGPC